MDIYSLSAVICRVEKQSAAQAYTWAWRIFSEYPEELRLAAQAWCAKQQLINARAGDMDLETVRRCSGLSPLQALELLYVFSKSPSDGYDLLALCTPRDTLI